MNFLLSSFTGSLQGSMLIHSDGIGKGSTFSFEIPLYACPSSQQNSGGFNGSSNQADEFSSVVGKHAFRRLSFSEFLLRGSFTTSTPVTYRSSSLKQQRRRSSWMEAAYHAVSDFSNQNHSNNIAHNIHVTIPALSLGGAADAERERTVDFETSSSHLTRLEEGTLAGNFFPSKLLQHHPSSGWRTGFDSPTIVIFTVLKK